MKRLILLLSLVPMMAFGQIRYSGVFYGNGSGLTNVSAGWFSNVISTVSVPNTNQLWVSGAGTAAANGEYVLNRPAFTGGFIYSNLANTACICGQVGGTQAPNYDQMPFYMGATTNNYSTASGASPYWYFSAVAVTAYWQTNNSYVGTGAGSGGSPLPTVVYGTNFVTATNSVWFFPNHFASEYTNGNLYVSQMGNDVLASNLQCAFATCQAAKRFAIAGDTINVEPGWYEDHDLLKNGVNWNFASGTTIAWDDPQIDLNPRSIFDDYAGPVTCKITGDRIHYTGVTPLNWPAMLITNPASHIQIQFRNADYAQYASPTIDADLVAGNPGIATPTASGLYGSAVLVVANCQYVNCDIDSVNGWTNTSRQLLNLNDQDPPNSFGTYITATNADGGFVWGGGETHIHLHSLIVTNFPPGIIPPYAYESGNANTTETSFFFTADYVNGFGYWDSSNTNARTWMNVTYFQAVPGQPALRFNGQEVNYYTGQKVSAYGGNCIEVVSGNSPGQFLWANVQKLTQNGNACWIKDSALGVRNWWNVLYFEDNSASTMTVPGIQINNGTNYFFGGHMFQSNGIPVAITAGSTTMQGMTIWSAGTNADIEFVGSGVGNNTNNPLTLQGDVLHTGSAANSIFATNQLGIWVYGNTNSSSCDAAPTNLIHFNGIGL